MPDVEADRISHPSTRSKPAGNGLGIPAPVLTHSAAVREANACGRKPVFRFNDAKKDGSYKPAAIVTLFSDIHKDAVLPGVPRRQGRAMQYFALGAAAGLTLTTILGILMAYRMSRRPVLVTLLLLAGIALPAALLLLAR